MKEYNFSKRKNVLKGVTFMQKYVINNNKNTNVEDFQMRDTVIDTLKARFRTYGYKQVRTSTFESYDMYSDISGTVNRDEMIKVIDTSGKVLVLRPDVTIPLTRTMALNTQIKYERLFYVLDVFRQSKEQVDQKESTQAGIECFGKNTPEIDSEIIMLAVHALKDLGFKNFKIEIGHAGFFKELIQQTNLNNHDLDILQTLIQTKNLIEIEPFLNELSIEENLQKAIQSIPMMYGNPEYVIKQAETIILNENMKNVLQNLMDVYQVLQAYGMEEYIHFNLGLINNMNYYSGIIFQGFVDSVGKPIIMGGRYDHLSKQFNSSIPAVGFAIEVDLLIHAITQQGLVKNPSSLVDININYVDEKQAEALQTAYQLRDLGYQVLVGSSKQAKYQIDFTKENDWLKSDNIEQTFDQPNELISLLEKESI